jgi:hypothetical protein
MKTCFAAPPTSFNWHNYVVLLAFIVGIVWGRRDGFLRSGLRTVMWILMLLLSLMFFETVADRFQKIIALRLAHLMAFLTIAAAVMLRCSRHDPPERLTIVETMMRSPSWREQVSRNSNKD